MLNKDACFKQIDAEVLPGVRKLLRDGYLVVLVGVTGSGKSVLAQKALPLATLISGLETHRHLTNECDADLIGEELDALDVDEVIRYRNQALALDHGVIFTCQAWTQVLPYLAGLEHSRFRVFDLNRIWEAHGLMHHSRNSIPPAVLAGMQPQSTLA